MKRLALPLALILITAAITLVLGEILLRVLGFSSPVWYRPHPELGWTLRPGIEAAWNREGGSFVRVNKLGFRDTEHALEKPANTWRVAILGDSYSEAVHVEMSETWWAQLAPRLEKCGIAGGKRVEVLNFGISGFGTAQELQVLETTASRFKPDLVVLQFTNGNDVRNNSAALEPEKDRPFYTLDTAAGLVLDRSFAEGADFAGRASRKSELVRVAADYSRVMQAVRSLKDVSFFSTANANTGIEQGMEPAVLAPPSDTLWEEAWRVTEALVAKTAERAKAHGAKFMLVSVPYAIQVHPDAKARAALADRLGVPDLFYPDKRLGAAAKKHGIDALTLATEMQPLAEKRNVHFHGWERSGLGRGHWNAEGHRVAAELVAERLCNRGN